jgi:hypothetical protein
VVAVVAPRVATAAHAANGDRRSRRFEVTKCGSTEATGMKKLIVHGDPGFRRDARIEVDGQEYVVFGVNRQGEWHGPDRTQVWCTVGSEDERETYERREYIPIHIDTEAVDAEAVTVLEASAA